MPGSHLDIGCFCIVCLFDATFSSYLCGLLTRQYKLGRIICLGHLELVERSTNIYAKLENSASQTELCFILGLCNVFGHFIPYSVRITVSSNKMLTKE